MARELKTTKLHAFSRNPHELFYVMQISEVSNFIVIQKGVSFFKKN